MKVEIINADDNRHSAVNVSGIVGFAGKNDFADVMLLQGLFNYIGTGLSPTVLGLGGDYNMPAITGVMDADTYTAISQFQVMNAGQLLMKYFDGRIHPASYGKRRLTFFKPRRYMSITLLHILAVDAAAMQGHHSYVQALANLDPTLAYHIDMAIIS